MAFCSCPQFYDAASAGQGAGLDATWPALDPAGQAGQAAGGGFLRFATFYNLNGCPCIDGQVMPLAAGAFNVPCACPCVCQGGHSFGGSGCAGTSVPEFKLGGSLFVCGSCSGQLSGNVCILNFYAKCCPTDQSGLASACSGASFTSGVYQGFAQFGPSPFAPCIRTPPTAAVDLQCSPLRVTFDLQFTCCSGPVFSGQCLDCSGGIAWRTCSQKCSGSLNDYNNCASGTPFPIQFGKWYCQQERFTGRYKCVPGSGLDLTGFNPTWKGPFDTCQQCAQCCCPTARDDLSVKCPTGCMCNARIRVVLTP